MINFMRRTRAHFGLVFGLMGQSACDGPERTAPNGAATASAPVASPGTSSAPPAGVTSQARASKAPFDFASAPLHASVSDFVLVPSKSAVDLAQEAGAEQGTFVYLGAHLEQLGERESEVRWLTQERAMVPNALIVPIRRGERASPGEIVLTSWASGSGLQRAIVVAGGTAESPKVRYLDLSLDNPAARADTDDLLPANTFHVIRQPGEAGSTLACRTAERVERVIVLKLSGSKLLGLGFAGRLASFEEKACLPLPLVPPVGVGDTVYVAALGGFFSAKVASVDSAFGRVSVRQRFAGAERTVAVGFTNVALSIPGMPPPASSAAATSR